MIDPIATLRALYEYHTLGLNRPEPGPAAQAAAIAELERRIKTEARRDEWLKAGRKADQPRYVEHHWDSWPAEAGGDVHVVELFELTQSARVRVSASTHIRAKDYHTALASALDAVT